MIILGLDERNITLTMDNLQAKMVVEALRVLTTSDFISLIVASQKVNEDGFELLASDVETACRGLAGVVGYWTDKLKIVKQDQAPPPLEVPIEEAPSTEKGDKPQVN